MKILVAPDSFKDSLSATDIAAAIATALSMHDTVQLPLADGGEGSIDVLKKALKLQKVTVPTVDPLMRDITAYYYMSKDTAFIELSVASGISLLTKEERNPMKTSTYGTGLLIKHALYQGVTKIKLFIGSSCTNDAAVGIARALGYIFVDSEGKKLQGTGADLQHIYAISGRTVHPRLQHVDVAVVCDVDNPFVGESGAVSVYAAQKGATNEDKVLLEFGMFNIVQHIRTELDIDLSDMPGAGAAGGVGGGAVAFLGAKIERGIEVVFSALEVEKQVAAADIIITGEGKLDEQTKHGKVVAGLGALAQKYNKPLHVICGQSTISSEDVETIGIASVIDLVSLAGSKEAAMEQTAKYIGQAAKTLAANALQRIENSLKRTGD